MNLLIIFLVMLIGACLSNLIMLIYRQHELNREMKIPKQNTRLQNK